MIMGLYILVRVMLLMEVLVKRILKKLDNVLLKELEVLCCKRRIDV